MCLLSTRFVTKAVLTTSEEDNSINKEEVLRVVDSDGEERIYSTKTASDRLRILADALEHYTTSYDTEYLEEFKMFKNSRPINVTVLPHKFRDILWADYVVSQDRPSVMRNSMVSQWPAFTKWNARYFARSFENQEVKVHYSTDKIIRMHSAVQPLGEVPDVKWKRVWTEGMMRVGRLFGETYVRSKSWFNRMAGYLPFFRDENQDELELQQKHALMFMNIMEGAPKNLRDDVTDVSFLTQPWRKVLELNMWSGTDNVTTPLHYDVTHNFYVQVKGRKRFVLFPPSDWRKLYLYPRIHPSTRMSQVASSFPNVDLEKFPKFKDASPYEVVLEAGDVLFIPAYWFHMPTALPSDAADVPMLYQHEKERREAGMKDGFESDLIQRMRESSESNALMQYPKMPSISVSVCSESYQVGIREDMLDYTLPIPADWPFHRKVTVLCTYVLMFFREPQIAQKFLTEVLENRFDVLMYDEDVEGLTEAQNRARDRFETILNARGVSELKKHKRIVRNLKRISMRLIDDVQSAIRGFLPEEWEIELANYLEDVISDVLGPLNVDPFMRWMRALSSDKISGLFQISRSNV